MAYEGRVREATTADASAVSALLRRAFSEFEDLYTPEAFRATVLAEKAIVSRLEEGPIWIVEQRSAVIGTVAVLCEADFVTVRGMAVDPQARGLGVGKALLQQTEKFAGEASRNRIYLYTTAFLERAIRLYTEAGFRFTGETANPHGTELLQMLKTR